MDVVCSRLTWVEANWLNLKIDKQRYVSISAFTYHRSIFIAVVHVLLWLCRSLSVDSFDSFHDTAPTGNSEVEIALNIFLSFLLSLSLLLLIRVNTPFCSLKAAHNN